MRDQGYLESLNRSNVRLTFDHIASVEPDGVISETGMDPGFIHEGSVSNMICLD